MRDASQPHRGQSSLCFTDQPPRSLNAPAMQTNETECIREDICRYRALLERTTDGRAKDVLNEMIGELEAQLNEGHMPHDRT